MADELKTTEMAAEDLKEALEQDAATEDTPHHEDACEITTECEVVIDDEDATEGDAEERADAPETDTASSAPTSPTTDDGNATAEFAMVTGTLELPVAVEAPAEEEPAQEPEPRLEDVGHTLAGWLRGRFRALGALVSQHRAVGILLALACVGGLLAGVITSLNATQTPPDDRIEADAREMLAPPGHNTSTFDDKADLTLQDVRITGKHPNQGDDGTCLVNVEATFANERIESRADGELTYRREGDAWTCTDARTSGASHRAIAGISTQVLKGHLVDLLMQADTREDGESLATLYADADVEVTDEKFDEAAQTEDVELHCSSAKTFVSYECDLAAHFRFVPASGAWELASATVDEGAYNLGLGPLVGTWHGSFTEQQSSSRKCLAASEQGLTVKITSAAMTADGGAHVEGTLSGVVHMHGALTVDTQGTNGDQTLENAPFSGDLAQEEAGGTQDDLLAALAGTKSQGQSAGIVFDCTTQDLASGKARLTLTFGQADDPDAASAALASTYTYEDTMWLILPVQQQSRFEDHFVLEKQ